MPKGLQRKGKGGNFYHPTRDKKTKKRIDIPMGTSDPVLAERRLGKFLAQCDEGGGDPTLLNKKFKVIADRFIGEVIPTYAKTTQKVIISRINASLIPFFGEMLVGDINDPRIFEFKFMREGMGRNASSIQGELWNLKSIMNLVRPNWVLPSGKLPQMRYRNISDPIDVYFNSEEEFQAILSHVPEELKTIVFIARKTGLRRANVLGMKWSWVNVIQKTITIPRGSHKNRKPHVVKMSKSVFALFRDMKIEGDLVFPPTGKFKKLAWQTWVEYVSEEFKKACRLRDRPDFTFHGLRHDFCSQLIMRGVPLYTVSKMVGHRSIRTTERYSHLSPEAVADKFDILDEPIVGIKLESKSEGIV